MFQRKIGDERFPCRQAMQQKANKETQYHSQDSVVWCNFMSVKSLTNNDLEVIKLFLLYIFFSLFNVDKFHGTLCLLGYDVMCNFMIFNLKLYYCIVYCIIYIILHYIILYYIILYNIV